MVNFLVDRPESGRGSRAGSPAAKGSRPSSYVGVGTEASDATPGTPLRTSQAPTTSVATQTLSTSEISTTYEVPPIPKPETVSYSVGVQTAEQWSPQRHDKSTNRFPDSDVEGSPSSARTPRAQKRLSRRERDREDELRQNLRREIEEELKAIKDPISSGLTVDGAQARFPARALTGEEMNAVTSSEDFLDFVDRSSKVIERALDQEYDVLANYAMDDLNGLDDDEDEGYASSRGRKGRRMKEIAQFYEDRWCRRRMISDINFSPKVCLPLRRLSV